MSPDWVFALKYPNLSWTIGTVNDAMTDNPQESSEELAYVAEVMSHRTALVERFGVNWSEKDKVVISVSSLAFGFSIGFLNP